MVNRVTFRKEISKWKMMDNEGKMQNPVNLKPLPDLIQIWGSQKRSNCVCDLAVTWPRKWLLSLEKGWEFFYKAVQNCKVLWASEDLLCSIVRHVEVLRICTEKVIFIIAIHTFVWLMCLFIHVHWWFFSIDTVGQQYQCAVQLDRKCTGETAHHAASLQLAQLASSAHPPARPSLHGYQKAFHHVITGTGAGLESDLPRAVG